MSDNLHLPPLNLPADNTSSEYKIYSARLFHKVAAKEFEAKHDKWVETTLVNLLIAVDYLIEAEEAKIKPLI